MAGSPLPHAGVRFPPPILFAGAVALGWLEHQRSPVYLVGDPSAAQPWVGWGLVLAALGLAAWAIRTFRRWKTAIIPHKPASRIVQDGPFAFSRNPMYLSMTTATIGVGVATNIFWILALVPVSLVLLWRLVIRREEAYLTSAFPDEYAAYRARVRRWL